MTDHTKRSTEEAKTHALFSEESFAALKLEWSQHRQLVAIVFRACWSGSLTIEQINRTAQALGNLLDTPDLQAMVTLLARKKVLRSRRDRGRTFYEVNY